jgi:hypothetical protein
VLTDNKMQARADIQSFDFRTLLEVHERAPAIRTVGPSPAMTRDSKATAQRSIDDPRPTMLLELLMEPVGNSNRNAHNSRSLVTVDLDVARDAEV